LFSGFFFGAFGANGLVPLLNIDIKANGSIGGYIYKDNVGKNCPLVEPCDEVDDYIHMNGKEVYKFVVKLLPDYIEELIANVESLLDTNLNKTDSTQLKALKNQMNDFYELVESLMEERLSANS
jgi:hypothetical protein